MNVNEPFERLYREYYPKLSAYASFYLKNDEAHDVVQEVFLSLLEKKQKIEEGVSMNAYLYRAVQNKCVDVIRHRVIRDQYATALGKKLLRMETDYFYTSRNEIEEGLLSKELNEQIDAAIEALPPKGKEVFKLYFFHRKTAAEIASILGLSRSTVENHIYTCLKTVRKKLTDYIIVLIFLAAN
jgi:RNA polymerase sigma-70 factor (ECF subfamily)